MDSLDTFPSGFERIERLNGHTPKMGKSAGQELNFAYTAKSESGDFYILMFCKPSHWTIIDEETWNKLQTDSMKDITWYYAPCGYIARTLNKKEDETFDYLHQFILGHMGNGKGKDSVDHMNGNKLDNRISNLRVATQSLQNSNRGKVSRHKNAKELPESLKGVELPKFCVYYKECYNKEKQLFREFFTVEGHPKQEGKRQATSKSGKVDILKKLEEAKQILKKLDEVSNDKMPWRCITCETVFQGRNEIKTQEESGYTFHYCATCFRMKGDMTVREFSDHIDKFKRTWNY